MGPTKRLTTVNTERDKEEIKEEGTSSSFIIFPWTRGYRVWWTFTVFAAAFTAYLVTYQLAFSTGWGAADVGSILDYILTIIFFIDLLINFNLAYYNDRSKLVYDRRDIARNYVKFGFWIDLVGVFPFYYVGLAIARLIRDGAMGTIESEHDGLNYLRIFMLFRLVRLHRVLSFFSIVKYSRKISLVTFTIIRNFSAIMFWCHLWACIIYFIARQGSFDPENTWIGSVYPDLNGFERYVLSLYWSVVTFSTTGYGDWSPVNSVEQVFCIIYLILNVVIMAWVIGSMTLLIVKNDNQTSLYHDTLQMLYQYSTLHNFDAKLTKRLKMQLKLGFKNRNIADEQVLRFFPAAVRRKVLRRLYMQPLISTKLMQGTRQQFVDAFLTLCSVETFSPGEELLHRGSISADLYLLLDGTVETSQTTEDVLLITDEADFKASSLTPSLDEDISITDMDSSSSRAANRTYRQSGDFLNELGFFTESPESDNLRTLNACKVLVLSRSHYKNIAADFPGSAGVVLQNLLSKYGNLRTGLTQMKALNVGKSRLSWSSEVKEAQDDVRQEKTVAVIRELIKMHINKQKDEHTTWFCFAASRNDAATITTMIEQGFDPDSSDYDNRTALMVASMKGNVEVVAKLLEHHANPNLIDVHGVSALYNSTKNDRDDVADMLLKHGGELSMSDNLAASTLCQAVSEGNCNLLKRLLRAKIHVNASDYDKRTAAHVAASEGNVAAFKLLVEYGADLSLEDRWGNTARSEAVKANSGQVLAFLDAPPLH